jgi:carbon starvation protein CstA
MICIRQGGVSLPEIIGNELGSGMRLVMRVGALVLLVLVGAVFVTTPASLLDNMVPDQGWFFSNGFWLTFIFLYFILATLLPIDKLIGRIYPVFGLSLLLMAVGICWGIYTQAGWMPELTDAPFVTHHPKGLPIFPMLCITIACGAISGFHGTQSPLMARCVKTERWGRRIFYGAMITEGLVALIWATVSMYFFYYGGWREVVNPETVQAFIAQADGGKTLMQYFDAPTVVKEVCNGWLGIAGGILALLGVVAAPITSGDTAFRSARLIVADFMKMEQHSIRRRLYICIPMFAAAVLLMLWQMNNPDGFNIIWQYFGWANQTLAVFTLWTITVYLVQQKKPFWMTLIPALFMTVVCSTFLLISRQAFGLSPAISYTGSVVVLVVAIVCFFTWLRKNNA